jgi:hypothetical protein
VLGVLPLPPATVPTFEPPAPPPDPPLPADEPFPKLTPLPPPVDVIELKTELEPFVEFTGSVVDAVPPAPTVTV